MVGIRKKKMIQELLVFCPSTKPKIKVHHIKIRKSSAFISMQRAWRRLQGMMMVLKKVWFQGMLGINHKKQSILDHNSDSTQPWYGYAPSCSLLSYAKAQWMNALCAPPPRQWAPTFASSIGKLVVDEPWQPIK
jgi:hypothetical protein